eukprot:1600142-Amphidinium_carterae.1
MCSRATWRPCAANSASLVPSGMLTVDVACGYTPHPSQDSYGKSQHNPVPYILKGCPKQVSNATV